MNIYLLAGIIAALAIVLVALAFKLVAMIRAGRPLIAVGRLEWHLPRAKRAPASEPADEPQPDVQLRARFQNLVAGSNQPAEPGAEPKVIAEAELAAPQPAAEAGLQTDDPSPSAEQDAVETEAEAGIEAAADAEVYVEAEAEAEAEALEEAEVEAETDVATEIERRIEIEFDRYCDGEIDLPAFEATLALIEEELQAEATQEGDGAGQAEAVIAWCKDWVRQRRLAA